MATNHKYQNVKKAISEMPREQLEDITLAMVCIAPNLERTPIVREVFYDLVMEFKMQKVILELSKSLGEAIRLDNENNVLRN